MNLGSIGVWSALLRVGDRAAMLKAAAELEELGYGTIWFPGREHAGLAERTMALLGATQRMVVATGIVNIWTHPAAEIAAEQADSCSAWASAIGPLWKERASPTSVRCEK